MHRHLAREAWRARRLRSRAWPILAIAALLASPLVVAGSHATGSFASPTASIPVPPLPPVPALVNGTYVPAPYFETGYGLAGAVAADSPLPSEIPIVVTLAYSNESELTALLAALSDPSSAAYHQYLTASAFDARFAPAQATYSTAVSYFEALGAFDLDTYADRVTISFQVAPANAERMFHTSLEEWRLNGREYYAPASTVELPQSLAPDVSAVVGLSSYSVASALSTSAPAPSTSSSSAPPPVEVPAPSGYLPPAEIDGVQYEYGPDLQVAYDEQSLFMEDGYPTNAVIATILWQGYYNGSTPISTPYGEVSPGEPLGAFVPSDISDYFNATSPPGQPHPVAVPVPIGGASPSGPISSWDTTGAQLENTIDIEMAGSLAPGATIFDVYGTTPTYPELDAAFAFILNPNASYAALDRVSAISNSWGDLDAVHPEWNQYVEEATARGITVLAATGDSGDYPDSPWQVGNPPDVNTTFPSSLATSTYGVLAVGGTVLTLQPQTLQIASSQVWNVPSEETGTTSGISPFYPEPTWQLTSSANELIRGDGRGVPDLAAIAANALLTITRIGYLYNATNASSIGMSYGEGTGTSVASPVEAGVIAEIDHVLEAQGNPWLGFVQPGLYQLANQEYGPLVNTTTVGYINGTLYTSPLPALPLSDTVNGSNHYYSARPGYDLVTGWGSLDAYNYTMYFLESASAGVNGRLSGVENNFTLEGLNVTSRGASSFFNASVQQNLFLANSLGAPVYWIQNVIYINWTSTGWAMNYTGWVVYPFFGLYYTMLIYEYNYPLTGAIVQLPATFDLRTILDPGTGFDNQTIEYFVGSEELTLPVPGAAYIIGGLWVNYSWQGEEHENGPYPGNPVPGGLSPQFGLVGGPSSGIGAFSAPTAGSMETEVEPYGSSTFEIPASRAFDEDVDQTGEEAENLAWESGPPGSWTLGFSPGSAVQGVLSYQPSSLYFANFTASGLPHGTLWYVNLTGGPSFSSTNSTISLALPSGTFAYTVASADPSWGPVDPSGTVTVDGAPQVIPVPFQSLPGAIAFLQTGLPMQIAWSVSLGSGQNATTELSSVTIHVANGTYSFRVSSSETDWAPQPARGTVVVSGDTVAVNVTFTLVEFTVSFVASGLPSGTPWFVNVTGGANYTSATGLLSFLAVNGTYAFTSGTPAAYQVTPRLGEVTVAGSNATETLRFSTPGSSSSTYPLWIIELLVLAFAVIAVALVAVALIARRRPPPPPG